MTTTANPIGPLVALDRVTRTYRCHGIDRVAVQSLDCEVYAGDHIALLGPSGSGKSTLLHLLAGLDQPTAGSVRWPAMGSGENGVVQDLAVVFQSPSLIPSLDAQENVELPLLIMGQPAGLAREHAQQALADLGLVDLAEKLPDEMSGGQAQRIAVARALAAGPRLVLADEPTGQLDQSTARRVLDALIAAAHLTGAALVIATHDPDVADRMTFCWRISDGHLVSRSRVANR